MDEHGPEAACKKLREMRDENVRDSSTVVDLGERLVRKHSHRFGDEMWLICEQVFIASLDMCRYDLAIICLKKLEKRFPDSDRVKKLQGMDLEAQGNYEDALDIYTEIENRDPTNAAVRKRKTAVLKAQGKLSDAIKSLTEYLKTFMADTEAWLELAELYTEELEFNKAAYCMEEVILSQPRNHLIHQRYAEIKYTLGGVENLSIAKDHFAEAAFLSNSSNIRALYGLCLTCGHLSGKGSDKEKRNQARYARWAAKMIAVKQKELGSEEANTSSQTSNGDIPELTSSVTELLNQLHLNAAT